MSKWQKEVFIMPADLQSESELIRFFESRFWDESKLIHSGAYTNLCGYRSYLNKLEPHTLQEFYNYK